MASDFPQKGEVFDYHYLWNWEDKKGQEEGSKKRPSCMALVAVNAKGKHVLYIVPITSKQPSRDRLAIGIPETEAHRAKLDTHIPLWVIVDEINTDIWEESYTLEDRTPRGQFGTAFTDTILSAVQSVQKTGKLNISKRT